MISAFVYNWPLWVTNCDGKFLYSAASST